MIGRFLDFALFVEYCAPIEMGLVTNRVQSQRFAKLVNRFVVLFRIHQGETEILVSGFTGGIMSKRVPP